MVLAGMGIRHLSMSPKMISSTKELLSRFTIEELQAISAKHLDNVWEMNL
jgi:phosphotransferase system enzyme I (PtsI)